MHNNDGCIGALHGCAGAVCGTSQQRWMSFCIEVHDTSWMHRCTIYTLGHNHTIRVTGLRFIPKIEIGRVPHKEARCGCPENVG